MALGLLGRVLFSLMLAESPYTLVRFAREGGLEATPFLVIGIIAAIRTLGQARRRSIRAWAAGFVTALGWTSQK